MARACPLVRLAHDVAALLQASSLEDHPMAVASASLTDSLSAAQSDGSYIPNSLLHHLSVVPIVADSQPDPLLSSGAFSPGLRRFARLRRSGAESGRTKFSYARFFIRWLHHSVNRAISNLDRGSLMQPPGL